jgi:tetrapyrrole methylase family protein/MazG family protein
MVSAIMNELEARVRDPKLSPFERLVRLMEILRSAEGCNWDRKQTHESLVPYLLEEAYEVVEVIESGHYANLREELGDLLTQVVFHAQLEHEKGQFEADDAVNTVIEKLINRHPHIFGERRELNPQQVRDQWERIKTDSGEKSSVLGGLPRVMPALTMAFRTGEKAGGAGFDWKTPEDVFQKIDEELEEIHAAMQEEGKSRKEKISNEIGDLLFAVASLARKLDIDPEASLRRSLDKFRYRFDRMEQTIRQSGHTFSDFDLEELEEKWQAIKSEQKSE